MKCSDARRQLSALVDRAGETTLRDATARHVDGCGACKAELAMLARADRALITTLGAVERATAPGYLEEFWPRLSARLDAESDMKEDQMDMSAGDRREGEKGARSQGAAAPTTDVAGKPIVKREEMSGLHEIKSLARTTLERKAVRAPTEDESSEESADLISSSSPTLGQVVLPEPGKEVKVHFAPAAPVSPAGVGGVALPSMGAQPAGPKSTTGLKWAVVGAALLAAAAAVAFVITRQNGGESKKEVATAATTGAAGATPVATAPSGGGTAVAMGGAADKGAADPGATGAGGAVPPAPGDTGAGAAPGGTPTPTGTATDVPAGGSAGGSDGASAKTPAAAHAGGGGVAVASAAGDKPAPKASPPKDSPKDAPAVKGGAGDKKAAGGDKPAGKAGADGGKAPSLDDMLDQATGGEATKHDKEAKATAPKDAPVGGAGGGAGAAASDLPEKLAPADVKKGMGSVKARVQACYDKFKVGGTVTIRAKIGSDGAISNAEAVDPKFRGTDTGECVAHAVEFASFPKTSGPGLTVNYPFHLE